MGGCASKPQVRSCEPSRCVAQHGLALQKVRAALCRWTQAVPAVEGLQQQVTGLLVALSRTHLHQACCPAPEAHHQVHAMPTCHSQGLMDISPESDHAQGRQRLCHLLRHPQRMACIDLTTALSARSQLQTPHLVAARGPNTWSQGSQTRIACSTAGPLTSPSARCAWLTHACWYPVCLPCMTWHGQ